MGGLLRVWGLSRRRDRAHVDAGSGHRRFGVGDDVFAEVEDTGSQHAGCPAFQYSLDEVLQTADPTAGDHGDVDVVGDGGGEVEVEALAGAVPIHRCQQDLAGTQPLRAHGPIEGIDVGRRATAVQVDVEAEPVGTAL